MPDEEPIMDSIGSAQDEDPEISDHLDVHVTVGSWVVESLAYIAIGFMNTIGSQLAGYFPPLISLRPLTNYLPVLAVVGIGFGAGRVPAFRSLVAGSVDPLKQGMAISLKDPWFSPEYRLN